ncbi:hypothetical protein P280DRAFT_153785 [Massarina eburnea CBS 473.64]|uniref:Uncharacterized protein n=1 Tax=Massarina eburnea CBS 473.64 TaxID=1395130 RepID=A0A6A6RM91_9PLEO|nr:hypothetical protein P280DRAFT_153785 [Massarina eburnea CBS 473.64]
MPFCRFRSHQDRAGTAQGDRPAPPSDPQKERPSSKNVNSPPIDIIPSTLPRKLETRPHVYIGHGNYVTSSHTGDLVYWKKDGKGQIKPVGCETGPGHARGFQKSPGGSQVTLCEEPHASQPENAVPPAIEPQVSPSPLEALRGPPPKSVVWSDGYRPR